MGDQLQSMRIFVKAAETGSFATAASQVGMSAQMVGRHVAQLEHRLGVRLINRSTHAQSLTEAGRTYLDGCRAALSQIASADSSVSNRTEIAQGLVRVTAPIGLGTALAARITRLLDVQPSLEIELHLSDSHVDLVADGFDAAIRIGSLPDSTLIARSLGSYRCVTCAAPAYLAERGVPEAPAELENHECLDYVFPRHPAPALWTFEKAGVSVEIEPKARLRINDGRALVAAALEGFGIIQVGEVKVRQELADGRLVRVLDDWEGPGRPVQLVFPSNRLQPSSVRLFADWMGRQQDLFGHEASTEGPVDRSAPSAAVTAQSIA